MSGFDDLHPAVQHHVVNSLGWSALRPLQEEAIGPILRGEHILAIAPTAGGKTEAAVLPLMSRLASEQWRGLSVLYVCPLRALLNNLLPRVQAMAAFVGARAELWHGDVATAARGRLIDDPPEVLLTTPESLEAILISARRDHHHLFQNLHTVVVDEVHAFGGDDRGWHLLAVLERLTVVAGRDIQRVGLSATVGQPPQLLAWLAGSSSATARVVAPPAASPTPPELTVDYVGSLMNAATVIARLHRGDKRLVFCDSRARVEELAVSLRERGVTTFVSHSSLALDERRRAEEAFSEATDCVIVSTSTLELGIDVGDLDRVIQIDSPSTVAAFLQRLGRTGRRPGATRNLLFLATTPEMELIKALGLLQLWSTGYVEPVQPPPLPYHLLAQQVLAYVLQEGSISRSRWRDAVGHLPEFARMADNGTGDDIVEHLLVSGMLFDSGHGILSMGPGGEQGYGRRHFMDLTSAFTSNPLFVVRHGSKEVGYLDPVALLTPDRHFAAVLLAGRVWQVTSIDWDRHLAWVERTEGAGRSRWQGSGQPLSAELCNAIRDVLSGSLPPGVHLTARALAALEDARIDFSWVRPTSTAVVESELSAVWWTFAGLHANASLAAALGPLAGSIKIENLSIKLDRERASAGAIRPVLQALDVHDAPAPAASRSLARGLKFADCLPERLADEVVAARLADPDGLQRVQREQIVDVQLA